ncbi:hypothetical protein ACFE04_022217 [Oxalis oulophora]
MDKVNSAVEKMKMLVGMEVEEEQATELEEGNSFSFIDDFNRDCTLSTQQRLYGFAICFVTGLAFTLLDDDHDENDAMLLFTKLELSIELASSLLVFFHPIKFGITFTFGNLLSLGSTAFLIGPKRQLSMMLDPVRIYATAMYLASMIIALFCALYVHNKILTLLAIILEFGALVWYSLSYIPFARTMVSKIMMRCFDTEF